MLFNNSNFTKIHKGARIRVNIERHADGHVHVQVSDRIAKDCLWMGDINNHPSEVQKHTCNGHRIHIIIHGNTFVLKMWRTRTGIRFPGVQPTAELELQHITGADLRAMNYELTTCGNWFENLVTPKSE